MFLELFNLKKYTRYIKSRDKYSQISKHRSDMRLVITYTFRNSRRILKTSHSFHLADLSQFSKLAFVYLRNPIIFLRHQSCVFLPPKVLTLHFQLLGELRDRYVFCLLFCFVRNGKMLKDRGIVSKSMSGLKHHVIFNTI